MTYCQICYLRKDELIFSVSFAKFASLFMFSLQLATQSRLAGAGGLFVIIKLSEV